MRRPRAAILGAALVVLIALVAAACSSDSDDGSATSTSDQTPSEVARDNTLTPLLVRQEGAVVRPVKVSDGRYHLLYAVALENATSLDLSVTEIEVLDGETVVESLDAGESARVVEVLGTRTADGDVGGAQVANAFLDISFDAPEDIPDALQHRVTVASEPLPGGGAVTTGASTEIDSSAVVPLVGPPLEAGSGYVAADTCCRSTLHIRAPLPINNKLWFAQRYAVDWEQIDEGGRFSRGDTSDPESYAIYGRQALAAADGTVVLVIDGLEDQVPGELPGTSIPLDEADGNSVVVDIGDGLYMMYAHLQSGSITVTEGAEVTMGQPIARVGNTGNSQAPHLHFHVMDGPSPLGSNGVPYMIDNFEVTGRVVSTEAFDAAETSGRPVERRAPAPTEHIDELPLDQSIVTFPV